MMIAEQIWDMNFDSDANVVELAKNKVPLYYVMDVAKQMHGNK